MVVASVIEERLNFAMIYLPQNTLKGRGRFAAPHRKTLKEISGFSVREQSDLSVYSVVEKSASGRGWKK